jgi:hypothetical protein
MQWTLGDSVIKFTSFSIPLQSLNKKRCCVVLCCFIDTSIYNVQRMVKGLGLGLWLGLGLQVQGQGYILHSLGYSES